MTLRREPLEILHRLSRAISQAAGLEAVYNIILEEIAAAWEVERASIMRYDPKSGHLKIVAAHGMEPDIWRPLEIAVGEGISGKAFIEGQPQLIRAFKGNQRYKTCSFLVFPVMALKPGETKKPVGLINLTDKKSGEPFNDKDLKLLTALSDQLAAYLHLSDLSAALQSAEKTRAQLDVARQIQQKLLPKNVGTFKGIDMAGMLLPAERVGADYYDIVPNGKTFLFCIADVSGHDMAGALLAFASRSCLRANLNPGKKTSVVMQAVNEHLFSDLFQSEQFISLFLGAYHPAKKILTYTNAGHPPPVLWQAKSKNGEWLFTQDSLLGIEPGLVFHQKKCKLQKGDTLLLYTDGLTEAANAEGERFGGTRLMQVIEACHAENAQKILNHLLDNWQAFTGPQPPQDDVTVLVLKIQ